VGDDGWRTMIPLECERMHFKKSILFFVSKFAVSLQDDYDSTELGKLSLYAGESMNWPPLCSTLTISLYSQNDC
jgi:hypothetical protein